MVQQTVKRLFDVVFAAAGLLLSTPVWLVIAAAIWLEDRGPIFYRQERVGQGGTRFWAPKFRSMVPQAEAGVGPIQARPDDPRVTRVGRWLRATAMDELPQLWSILVGEMSVVGPRALRPDEVEVRGGSATVTSLATLPAFATRCSVRPGLTGLAQVYAPRDLPHRKKFRYDLLYITRQSLWLDLTLVALSFWITLCGAWERRLRSVGRPRRRPPREQTAH